MKFVHIADIHFDKPFTMLGRKNFSENRRLDQRRSFKNVIDYIKKNRIEYLFISGDLYEHEYVKETTIEYINNCFKEIPATKVFITPGNHDPYLKDSYYNKYNWNDNVIIFDDLRRIQENDKLDIYGYGFTDFYSKEVELPTQLNENKINILLMHADLNGSTKQYGDYNPILESKLQNSKFDYIALGHIHKPNFNNNIKANYSGSLISSGFDELGAHGMIAGKIDDITHERTLEFIKLDDKEFIEIEVDISDINSKEELIEKINLLNLDENNFYKILLIGKRNIDIQTNEILKYINNSNVLKIKNISKIGYNLEEISKEQTLKGIFVKELLDQINEENEKEILESIYIGLDLL